MERALLSLSSEESTDSDYDPLKEDQTRNPETAEIASNRAQGVEGNEGLQSDQDERQDPSQGNADEPDGINEDRSGLHYDAKSSLLQITPASVCLLVAVATVSSVTYNTPRPETTYQFFFPYQEEGLALYDKPTRVYMLHVGMFIGCYLVQTIVMAFLCKYRCCMIIHGLLAFPLLLLVNHAFFGGLCKLHNMSMDYFTVALFHWNICIVGLVCLLWKGPLVLQSMYLIWVSALMAYAFLEFSPEWILWSTLCVISQYATLTFGTLVAAAPQHFFSGATTAESAKYSFVTNLACCGVILVCWTSCCKERILSLYPHLPLAMDPLLPGTTFVLQPTMTWTVRMTDGDRENKTTGAEIQLPQRNSDGNGNNQPGTAAESSADSVENGNRVRELHQAQAENESGAKLRLGDFIVYSLLAGKASSNGDWNTTIACFVAILIGLCFTLLLSAIYRKTVPTLPISLALGAAFNFVTRKVIQPYTDALTSEQIFI